MLRRTSLGRLVAMVSLALATLPWLVGCDRLGIGRTATVSAVPAPLEEPEPEPPPPARDPAAPRVSGTAIDTKTTPDVAPPAISDSPGGVAASGDGEGDQATPPARDPGEPPREAPVATDELDKPMEPPPEAKGLLRLPDPQVKGSLQDVWVDKENKRIVLGGRVCKRTGDMELFACLRRTKEHESIVSVRARAYAVHATLMALGIKPGRPVQFFPEFRAADGPEIEVMVYWTDDAGKRQSTLAQEWLRNVRTKKAMEQPWIFGGSGFWKDDEGQLRYQADDGGELICVSNFASAMLDLPINAPNANSALLFEGFHERIPKPGTPVALILRAKPHLPLEAPPVK